MAQPQIKAAELARQLVTHESFGSSDKAASAGAVETVCRKLRDYLNDLLGYGGVAAVMGRALKLAKREHPLLAGVTLGAEPSVCFTGLTEALAAGTPEDAAAACSAVLTHIFDLLILLLGDELGLQPVRKLWPHLASSVVENDQ
jgi:hypothetical protein